MLKQFLQKFINKKIDGIQTFVDTIYLDFLLADVADEYIYGYCQEMELWVLIPYSSINSIWSRKTLQEMEKMEVK